MITAWGYLKKLLLSLTAFVVALVMGEVILRVALDEVNYLSPKRVDHPVLRHIIKPKTGGHDAWGFRNYEVPETAELVTIGDSQTYGWTATADESWPYWIDRLSNWSVYNLSLGGYGPTDYEFLFHQYALQLDPQFVLFGLYLGNDLVDTFRTFEKRRKQSSDSLGGRATNGTTEHSQSQNGRFLEGTRNWLSRHAMLYQVLKLNAGSLVSTLRFRETVSMKSPDYVILDSGRLKTAFRPEALFENLSLDRRAVRIGLEKTLRILKELDETCGLRDLHCYFLIIPTKESVYLEKAGEHLSASTFGRVRRVVEAEKTVKDSLTAYFDRNRMTYVDPLPMLRKALADGHRIYPSHDGAHFLGEGYKVLGEAVLKVLPSE